MILKVVQTSKFVAAEAINVNVIRVHLEQRFVKGTFYYHLFYSGHKVGLLGSPQATAIKIILLTNE